jgi:hypothetical protein
MITIAARSSSIIRCYLANLCPVGCYVVNEVRRLADDSFSHHSRTMCFRMQGRRRVPAIV